jgi:hypothetical protein
VKALHCMTLALATAAALALGAGSASADMQHESPAAAERVQVKKTFTLWVGKPAGATIRSTPYSTGKAIRHIPQGGAVYNIQCGMINNKGNYWYRQLNSEPDLRVLGKPLQCTGDSQVLRAVP